MDYTDITTAKQSIAGHMGVTLDAMSVDVDGLLELYSAKDKAGTQHYRPYIVAAMLISANPNRITRAEDVEFADPNAAIKALMNLQKVADRRLGLVLSVPRRGRTVEVPATPYF